MREGQQGAAALPWPLTLTPTIGPMLTQKPGARLVSPHYVPLLITFL